MTADSENEVRVGVSEIIVYPEYDPDTAEADIAMLRLAEPVEFTENVRPACLADSSDELRDYRRCFVAGWGALQENGNATSYAEIHPKVIVKDNTFQIARSISRLGCELKKKKKDCYQIHRVAYHRTV